FCIKHPYLPVASAIAPPLVAARFALPRRTHHLPFPYPPFACPSPSHPSPALPLPTHRLRHCSPFVAARFALPRRWVPALPLPTHRLRHCSPARRCEIRHSPSHPSLSRLPFPITSVRAKGNGCPLCRRQQQGTPLTMLCRPKTQSKGAVRCCRSGTRGSSQSLAQAEVRSVTGNGGDPPAHAEVRSTMGKGGPHGDGRCEWGGSESRSNPGREDFDAALCGDGSSVDCDLGLLVKSVGGNARGRR
ncbi:hypothetical protein B296_00017740, partial [Ensete ventricosum]